MLQAYNVEKHQLVCACRSETIAKFQNLLMRRTVSEPGWRFSVSKLICFQPSQLETRRETIALHLVCKGSGSEQMFPSPAETLTSTQNI